MERINLTDGLQEGEDQDNRDRLQKRRGARSCYNLKQCSTWHLVSPVSGFRHLGVFWNCITQQFCDVLHNTSLAFEDEGENETEYHHEG